MNARWKSHRYNTFSIAVPSDRLPMALPPDWLHQTDTEVVQLAVPKAEVIRKDVLRSTRILVAGDFTRTSLRDRPVHVDHGVP